ncbi:hypothetical protein IRJ41_016261 [Triplophysa rosa]|uniref:Uncharacterized protein n=1 Tax=Triplophysa rosa TaxID=992332 RepID=A0A9W7X3F8_TRIRA|nr:hypothetical protein IRJ41_016261 [Triplophysa rosa]
MAAKVSKHYVYNSHFSKLRPTPQPAAVNTGCQTHFHFTNESIRVNAHAVRFIQHTHPRLIHTHPGATAPRNHSRPTPGALRTGEIRQKLCLQVFQPLELSFSDIDSSLRVFDRLWLTLDLRGCQFVKYPKRGGTSLQRLRPKLFCLTFIHVCSICVSLLLSV